VEFSDNAAIEAVLKQQYWEMDGRQLRVERSTGGSGDGGRSRFQERSGGGSGDGGRSRFQRNITAALLMFFFIFEFG